MSVLDAHTICHLKDYREGIGYSKEDIYGLVHPSVFSYHIRELPYDLGP